MSNGTFLGDDSFAGTMLGFAAFDSALWSPRLRR